MNTGLLRHAVATVLTVYGIETNRLLPLLLFLWSCVATVLTVYGIETTFWLPYLHLIQRYGCNSAYRLRY